ncbi:MAG: oxidoreductase [Rhodospirillaceae bacterium]|nr:oxidoreductase [Rhodospirillaceae bacterium]|tara:strand:- start:109 stop:987 length:879 start_codon:yes stop_codon:yes gene_type:complete
MTDVKRVAFLGLGVMGFPMAGHLASNGHDVVVYNRTMAKANNWAKSYEGSSAATPRDAVADREIVFTCVGNDDDVRSVVYGDDGAFAGMGEGTVFVDHTTASANLAIELYDTAREKGVGFLDAPVSGGQAGAENGVLTVMCGGEEDTFNRVRPVIDSYSRAVTLMGIAGAGQLTKMVNQICIAGLLQGLSEGMNFALKAGLDPKTVVDVISKGAAGSWQMENRALTMAEDKFDFGFAVNWMRKDLNIILEEAQRNKARLPATSLIDQFYAQVQERGGGRWDTSSLIHLLMHE